MAHRLERYLLQFVSWRDPSNVNHTAVTMCFPIIQAIDWYLDSGFELVLVRRLAPGSAGPNLKSPILGEIRPVLGAVRQVGVRVRRFLRGLGKRHRDTG